MNGHQLTPNSDRPGTANGIDHQRDRPVVAKQTCPPKPCDGYPDVSGNQKYLPPRHEGFYCSFLVSLWREEKNFTPKCKKSTIEEPMEVIRWLDYR
jgi:hypothetical protein